MIGMIRTTWWSSNHSSNCTKMIRVTWILRQGTKLPSRWKAHILWIQQNDCAYDETRKLKTIRWIFLVHVVLNFESILFLQYKVPFKQACVIDITTEPKTLQLIIGNHIETNYMHYSVGRVLMMNPRLSHVKRLKTIRTLSETHNDSWVIRPRLKSFRIYSVQMVLNNQVKVHG